MICGLLHILTYLREKKARNSVIFGIRINQLILFCVVTFLTHIFDK